MRAPAADTPSNAPLPAPNPIHTMSTALNNAFTLQAPSGNQTATSSRNTSGGSSSNFNKPLQRAVTSVTNAIGSVASGLTKSISKGPSSQTNPASTGPSASH